MTPAANATAKESAVAVQLRCAKQDTVRRFENRSPLFSFTAEILVFSEGFVNLR
jgi:hypothetical protein